MKAKKGLQKFTDFESRIKSLLELKKINKEDIKDFTDEERINFERYIVDELNKANDDPEKKEVIANKCEDVLFEVTKNQLWEQNHDAIKIGIINHINNVGRMPSIAHISQETKLSRPTVYKHLREFENHKIYKDMVHTYKFMSSQVFAKVMKMAIYGDLKAAKLYFDVVGGLAGIENNVSKIGTQNNYIQINGMIFTEEKLKQLPPEQLKAIETILTTAEPQTMEAEVIPSAEDESRN